MKDTPKKLGAVALAGVMVAGGTLQSGTVVANAEGVNDRARTTASTMSDGHVDVFTKEELIKKVRKTWDDLWRTDLLTTGRKATQKNAIYRDIYGYINRNYRKKMDIIALGDKRTVEKIVEETEFQFRNNFEFDPIYYNYNDMNELITGKVSYNYNSDDRVVNRRGISLDYGAVTIDKFRPGQFYKLEIGKTLSDKPVCHVFLYVKN